jgi:hypothetical protein
MLYWWAKAVGRFDRTEAKVAAKSLAQRAHEKLARAWLLRRKALFQRMRRMTGVAPVRRHVFVAGMQRSGTNMMMEVLERSRETDVYHERDARAFINYQMQPRPVIHSLAARSPAPVFVIKSLCELQELRTLLDEFTPAQAIWVVRDYEDVVNSMLVSFRNQAKQVQRIAADRNGSGWLGTGMSEETHTLVRQLVHPYLGDASAAALQWYFRNILLFEQGLDQDPRVLLVAYEALVSEPHQNFRAVFDFLGLPYRPEIAAGVFAGSIRRQRPPPIEPAVREQCEQLRDRLRAALKLRWEQVQSI